MKLKKIAALLAVAGMSAPAFATNGMNMEGYGPIATGMGGASMAYDNGTAGLINNPATLGLMASGTSRLDVAVGGLHPDVKSSGGGMNTTSGGDAYYMPAVGYVRKDGKLTWGAGMMAQGGMGTEYGSSSLMNGYQSMMFGMTGGAMGTQGMSAQSNRSELGIGRIMLPLTYDVSDTLRVGGTLDYLWGGLDIQMQMSGAMFGAFTQRTSTLGYASGSMVNTFGMMMGANPGQIGDVDWAHFDFSEGGNKMKQRLKTNGLAGNIGFVWQASPQLSIGGVYHAKTRLSDMEGTGTVAMQVAVNGMGTVPVSVSGKLKVVDFQWPETYGIGLAYQVNDRLLVAADYKRIGWAKVMRNFRMSFSADAVQTGMAQMAGLGGQNMEAVLYQNWRNQNVFEIGASYKMSDALTLRVGANLANNPIPDEYMNPLFPATIKNHYTFGLGYAMSKASSVDFALVHAPKVTVNNGAMGVSTSHAQQNNWQLMYSQRF